MSDKYPRIRCIKTQGQKPYRHKPWLALLLSLLVVGSILVYTMYKEHGRIEQREQERLSAQAKVIDANLTLQLYGVYRALEEIRKELPFWKGESGQRLANHRLSDMAEAMPGIRTFLILDVAGQIVACNRKQVIGQNMRQRDYFQGPVKNPNQATLYISPPFKTVLGNFVINLGMMIPGPTGKFNGVVSASLDSDYFNVLLGSVLYAPDMWCALAHGDGKLFLRVPGKEVLVGLDLAKPGTLFTRHIKSGRQATVFTGHESHTSEERMMAQRTVRSGNVPMDKPLVVSVSRDVSALYYDWRREAVGKGVLFVMLVLATSSALYFYQRRQQKNDAISAGYIEELLHAKERALHANEAKSRFLATVAHEFRTPLSLLTSSTDILDRYGERLSRDELTQQYDFIRNSSQQMASLVDSVLVFSSSRSPSCLNHPVKLDIWKFCQRLASEVRTTCSKGQSFTVSIPEEDGTVMLDEVLFRRVVENLLTNAFRYTPADGAVSLHVNRESDRLQVVISDSGIGIPDEEQKLIFEAFYRCQNVADRRGLGLGLAIVRETLLRLDGAITVVSSIGSGTTMQVEIPLVDASELEE